jgi:hypothetical protein
MTEIRKVKIENILEFQIPSFLSSDSPFFKEFLAQYYISQTHLTGTLDLANNIEDYKNISTYTSGKVYNSNLNCYLIDDILSFDDEIEVNSTFGFPDRYGLLQIDNEIITYTEITENKFLGCVRGFSGISKIEDSEDSDGLIFSATLAEDHYSESIVKNLNLNFYGKLFQKFKSQYLPDFENRKFNSKIDLELLLNRARDFYLTKGTDTSFKILFEILYGDEVSIIKPQEYIIRSSDSNYLVTKNILVEPLFGILNPSDIIGYTISQELPSGVTASAAIYNVETRPIAGFNLYEISLDSESFIYNFNPTKKTTILEQISNTLIVDSTIGFEDSGLLYLRLKNIDQTYTITTLTYSGKTINEFLNIIPSDLNLFGQIKSGDELIEDNLLQVILDDTSTVKFRLLNVIGTFDYSNTNTINVNDLIYLSTFGENFTNRAEFSSWIYNYPTYHKIKNVDSKFIEFEDSVNFTKEDEVELIDETNSSIISKVKDIISENKIEVSDTSGLPKITLKKKIKKSNLIPNECVNIQNTYFNESNNSLVVASSSLPLNLDLTKSNSYTFNIVGIGTTFITKRPNTEEVIEHNLLSGNKIYVDSNNSGIKTGQYYIRRINSFTISLYQSTGDLYLSFAKSSNLSSYSNAINLTIPSPNNIIGVATVFDYHNANNNFLNQLLLKEFNVEDSLYKNKVTSGSQIYSIEDAYNAFRL